jgi:ATP-dependent DNA helicase 2 subunit 2
MAQKEAVVIILDVGLSMTKEKKSTELLEAAIKAAFLLVQQKLIGGAKDEIGLVLFGTHETRNELAESHEGYENITVLRNITTPDLELLRQIENITPGDRDGDFISALIVAMDMLIKKVGHKSIQKRIFLVTSAGGPANTDDLPIIVSKLQEMDARLNVIGVEFGPSEQIGSQSKKLDTSEKNQTKIDNVTLLREICTKVKGVVVPIAQAIDMMSSFRSKSVLQRTVFRGWFEVSPFLKIPVWAYKKTSEVKFPTLKRVSKVVYEGSPSGSGNVVIQRTFHNRIAADPEQNVPSEERIKGYRYGRTLVPFSKIDEEALKYPTEPCLKLIGFCPISTVPRYHFMADTEAIVALPTDNCAATALSAIIHAMAETDSCAIVRFVKRKNAPPQLGILTPSIKPDYEVLYYNKLPFAEDIRQYPFASLLKNTTRKSYIPSEEQLNAAELLINELDLMTAEKDDEGEPMEALNPKYTYNPALQHFYQCVTRRALHPEEPLPQVDPNIRKYSTPDETLFAKAQSVISHFKEKFVLVRTDQKEKEGRRRFWSEAFLRDEDITLESYLASDKKRQKLDHPEDALQHIIRGGVADVGTINPVADFKAMLSRRDVDLVGKAIKQMKERIVKYVNESIKDSYYDKALECLRSLRAGCIQEEEPNAFNSFMSELKNLFKGKRHNDFWQKVVASNITLITVDESTGTDVTKEDAKLFLESDEKDIRKLETKSTEKKKGENTEEDVENLLEQIE